MKEISIKTTSKTYPVFIGLQSIEHLSSFLKNKLPSLTSILIITDETVGSIHLSSLKEKLLDHNVHSYVVPSGEKAKTFDVYYDCLTYALNQKLDRHALIIAFGGGAVGDLAGFVAATYMRGIPFIQVPTTILAHDSAVGGKVAINHPSGKNMIGAFYQPEAVFYNIEYLNTLPLIERRSGFAEVIKHALISDEYLYKWLLDHLQSLQDVSDESLVYLLSKGIEIKGNIVSQDEKETGVRAFLNFGHTLGHAIEAEIGYGKISHGEAVVIGMHFALILSKKMFGLNIELESLKSWLKKLGYEIHLPTELNIHALVGRMKQDKKSIGQKIRFVLLEKIGNPTIVEVSEENIIQELEMFKNGEE